jgi:hypothetical protein
MVLAVALFLAAQAGVLAAQNEAEGAKGTVAGMVVYSDTKTPARLAQVTLMKLAPAGARVQTADEVAGSSLKNLMGACGLSCITSTGLDGRFVLTDVPVGRYIVLAGQSGALNPLARLDMGALNQAGIMEVSEDQLKPILADLAVVTVAGAKPAEVTVNLTHGASIAGTLSYDDGSPAVGVRLHLLNKTRTGSYEEPGMMSLGAAAVNATILGYNTDDQGRFRIAGLPAGSYALRAELPLGAIKNLAKNLKGLLAMGMAAGNNGMKAGNMASMLGDGLSVFSGNVLFKKDLKPLQVGENEQMSSADIVIPLGAMHSISARVVDASTGHPLDVARLILLDAEGKETLRSGFVDDDGSCTFDYVPEGLYTLRAADGMDTSQMGKMLDLGFDPKKAVRYASVDTKIQVSGDVSGVLLQVGRIESKN